MVLSLANCINPCGNCFSCISIDQCECFDGWTGDKCCTGTYICIYVINYNNIAKSSSSKALCMCITKCTTKQFRANYNEKQ